MGLNRHRPVDPYDGGRAGRGGWWQRLWWSGAYLTLALGLVAAFVMWGAGSSLVAAAALAIASWAVVVALRDEEKPSVRFRDLYVATGSGIAVVAGVGLVSALRWPALLVVGALLLTAPGWRRRVRAWRTRLAEPDEPRPDAPEPGPDTGPWPDALAGAMPGRGATPPDQPATPAPARPDPDPTALDDEALCREWRTSFVRLQAAVGPIARAQVVARRQAILDELAHRHEAGIARWLASGARAASNPMRFLGPAPRHHHP
jgi:hypothetical protein